MKPSFLHDSAALSRETSRSLLLVASVMLVLGCAGIPMHPAVDTAYDYFAVPDANDPWTPKISGWQRRERAGMPDVSAPASVDGAGDRFEEPSPEDPALRAKYASFRADRRREVAREFADWIQSQAKQQHKNHFTDLN